MSQFFGLEDGVIVYKLNDHIMVIRCHEAKMGNTEVLCKKENQIVAKGHEILQAYFYFHKLYIVSKDSTSNNYQLLRFNKKFEYLPKTPSSAPGNEVKDAIVLSTSTSIKWDLKIISDDIYVFVVELRDANTNDVPKLIQITIEEEKISSNKEFSLNLVKNGITDFKCGDIQFLPGSSREIFIVNKAELVDPVKKY